jgi:glycylpeptide N-tetradecanoyltransferase
MTEPSPLEEVTEMAKKVAQMNLAAEGAKVTKETAEPETVLDINSMSQTELQRYIQVQSQMKMIEKAQAKKKKEEEALTKDHKFWDTQPMVKKEVVADKGITKEGKIINEPVNPIEDIAKVRAEPYPMPAGFVWCELDVNSEEHMAELYKLLTDNYVEDDDAMFRFDYSAEFLRWALTLPGFRKEWHVGVRVEKTGKLMASITGVPASVSVRGEIREMVEINFLCVHKKLRDKRLAPVLIKEITRRVNLTGRWQAVYTAGVVIPTPVGRTQYFHRNLQVEKLIDIGFSYLPKGRKLTEHVKSLHVANKPKADLRAMELKDVPQVTALLNAYLTRKCRLHQVFTEAEVAHLMLPRKGVIEAYVKVAADGNISDFLSFYYLPSSVMKHPKHKTLSAVYSYYNVPGSLTLADLMADALSLAKAGGADVFNALNVMENGDVFTQLQFGAGDGFLQYYVYNWQCSPMDSKEVGIVLV